MKISSSTLHSKEEFQNMIVYHGTSCQFDEFLPNTYFTNCPNEASDFATGEIFGKDAIQIEGSRVIPVFLNFQNPFIITDPDLYEDYVMDSVDIEFYKNNGHDGLIYAPNDGCNYYFVIFDNVAVEYMLDYIKSKAA